MTALLARLAGSLLVSSLLAGAPAPLEAAAAPTAARVAAAAAEHPVARLGGGTLSLPALKGQVVVLNFWASWCGPCRRELPRLAQLDAELRASGGRVVAVSIDTDPRNAASFATRVAPGLVAYHDGPDGLVKALDVPALPYTIVLDRDGSVAWAGGGADASTLSRLATTARRLAAVPEAAGVSTEGVSR